MFTENKNCNKIQTNRTVAELKALENHVKLLVQQHKTNYFVLKRSHQSHTPF